jgi:ATP-dependent Clp protease ATP-binding subunit ClpA
MERDRALARRFQKIEVLEPSSEETRQILEGLRPRYEEFHAVRYLPDGLDAAVKLSERYLHDRKMPDKAIDLMDEAGADAKLEDGNGASVGVDRMEAVVARMAQIPPRQVSSSDKNALKNLEEDLRRVVFGQDRALTELATAIKLSRAGLRAGGEAHRLLPVHRADRRRQDRGSPSSSPRPWASSWCAST